MDTSGPDKDMLDEVLAELTRLRKENRQLVSRVEALEGGMKEPGTAGSTNPRPCVRADRCGTDPESRDQGISHISRRGVFKLGGAALGGAALAVGGSAIGAGPAAADGPNVLLGNGGTGAGNNAGSNQTSITATVASAATLEVINNGTNGIGLTALTAGGVGVEGDGNPGVHGTGPLGAHGEATTIDGVGVRGTVRGITVPGFPSFAASGHGVVAEALTGTGAPPTANSAGLLATNEGLGTGVTASSTSGRGIVSTGKLAQLRLSPGSGAHPASGASGDLFEDNTGILWLCVGGSSWRKLGGLKTAGQLHILPSPVRVYDSRSTGGPIQPGNTGERTVSLALGTDGHTPAVPAGAQAALFNLTIVNTGTNGFLAAFSNAVAYPGSSDINWFQVDTVDSTSVTSAVDTNAKIKLHCAGTPTDFVIDVKGYYQ